MICIEKRYFIGIRKCINITVTAGILVKHGQTRCNNSSEFADEFLNEFDHFVWLALKALNIHR